MGLLFDTLQDVFQYMRQYKARTFMTMFGIIWGTMTVIMLLSMGVGVGKQLSKSMHGIGEGIGIVWCGATSIPFEGYGRGRAIRMTMDDIEIARQEIADIKRISPEFSTWRSAVRVGDKVNKPNLTGIIPEYGPMRNVWPEVQTSGSMSGRPDVWTSGCPVSGLMRSTLRLDIEIACRKLH